MNKTYRLLWPSSVVALLATIVPGFAKPVPLVVSFLATAPGNTGRHIGMKAGGGLILGSTVITHREIFTLTDLNGGALLDGDSVQIATVGDRPTYWQENGGKITRTGERPNGACVFKVKWKQKGQSLMLRTASGKLVSGPGKGKDLVTVSKVADPTTVFALLKNPTSAAKSAAFRPSSAKKMAR